MPNAHEFDLTTKSSYPMRQARGFKPGWKPRVKQSGFGFDPNRSRAGGSVSGPGTGTSDSIPARLSHGEYVLPADTVRAIGVENLDALRDATHTPVAPQQPGEPQHFFATGGLVGQNVGDDDERRRNSFGDAAAASRNTGVTQVGSAQRPGILARSFPGTSAAVRGVGDDIRSAYKTGGVGAAIGTGIRTGAAPAIGMVDDTMRAAGRALDPAATALRTAVTGDPTPIAQVRRQSAATRGVVPTAQAATRPATTAGSPARTPQIASLPSVEELVRRAAAPAATTGTEIRPGIYQHGPGQFSDRPDGMGFSEGFTGNPSQRNIAAMDALAARSQADVTRRALEPRGFQPGVYRPGPSTRDLAIQLADPFTDLGRARRNLRIGLEGQVEREQRSGSRRNRSDRFARDRIVNSMLENFDRQVLQSGQAPDSVDRYRADLQAQSDAQRNAIDQQQADQVAQTAAVERQARGFDVGAAAMRQHVLDQYAAATTQAERDALRARYPTIFQAEEQSLRDNFMTVGGGQEWDERAGQFRNVPQRLVDLRSGQEVGGGQADAPTITNDAQGQAMLAALPPGSEYIAPDGTRRRKD